MARLTSKSSHSKFVNAKLRFDYVSTNNREVQSLEKAILPESMTKGKCLLRPSLKKEKAVIHLLLDFEAADIIALRASINTNLRLISSAIRALNTIGKNIGTPADSRERLNKQAERFFVKTD
jgi:tRNA threonylcarbamoyladenosine modification (KEOPS) complex  Pcc1 subunit